MEVPVHNDIDPVRSLGEALPRLDREEAVAARLMLDARVGAVLQRWTGYPVRMLGLRRRYPQSLRLRVSSAAGEFAVELDALAGPMPAMLREMATDPRHQRDLPVVVNLWLRSACPQGPLDDLDLKVIEVSPVAPEQRGTDMPPAVRIGQYEAHIHGVDGSFGLLLDSELAEPEFNTGARLPAVKLPATLELARRALPVRLLREAKPGAVVLLGRLPLDLSWRVGLRRGRRAKAQLLDFDSAPVLTSALQPYEDSVSAPVPIELTSTSFGDIELSVTFEIVTETIDINTLASLGPGQVITLDRSIEEATVLLRSNGQTLGRGRLVAVGPHLGVRIEQMAWAHHVSSQH